MLKVNSLIKELPLFASFRENGLNKGPNEFLVALEFLEVLEGLIVLNIPRN